MKVLDLFSGIGGFSLGLERAGMQTVAFCEIEPFCRKVLKKHWPDVPIYEDVRELNVERLRDDGIKRIDVVCGGFPCQPFSIAGRRKGAADHRDLWPEMCRIIEETKPAWVIGENVANFTDMAFTRTKADLESRGYQVQPFIIPACAVGAPHRRDRVWIVAHLAGDGGTLLDHIVTDNVLQSRKPKKNKPHGKITARVDGKGIGDNSGAGYDGAWKEIMACENPLEGIATDGKRKVKPAIRRGIHGVSRGLDEDIRRKRINTLGNTLVPQIAQIIGRSMLDLQAP